MSGPKESRGASCSGARQGGERRLGGRKTKGKRVWHSRPLLEVVPSDQPFVYYSPDHPVLQSPLAVQHTPSLEQLLFQLLQRSKTLIRLKPCTAPRGPGPGHPGPSMPSGARLEGSGTLGETKSGLPRSYRSRPVDLSSRSPHGYAAVPVTGPRFHSARGLRGFRRSPARANRSLGGRGLGYIKELGRL